jgi:hypothetical protein
LHDKSREIPKRGGVAAPNDGLDLRQRAYDLDTIASIGILTWFDDPYVFEGCILCKFQESALKVLKFGVIYSIPNVEGQRQDIERVLIKGLIIEFHVCE